MDDITKEFPNMLKGIEEVPFDKALPEIRKRLWDLADKYNSTGPEVFMKYMDWRSEQLKKESQ